MKILNFFKNVFNKKHKESNPEFEKGGFLKSIKKQKVRRINTKLMQVKNHLISHGTIDSWTAIELYGATRLSAIIFTLR